MRRNLRFGADLRQEVQLLVKGCCVALFSVHKINADSEVGGPARTRNFMCKMYFAVTLLLLLLINYRFVPRSIEAFD